MVGQKLGGYLAHIPYTQSAQETGKRHSPGFFYGLNNVLGRFFSPAVKVGEIFLFQPEKIRNITDKPLLHQLLNRLFPQPFNIDPAFTGKMDQALQPLGRAVGIDAAGYRLPGRANQRMAANRAILWKYNGFFLAGSLFDNRFNHLGNDITGPLDEYRITDPQVFTFYFIVIMQGCPLYDHAFHPHGFQQGHRRHRSGAANLKIHPDYPGRCLNGRKFPGNGPARRPGGVAQPLLQMEIIHLHYHAVNFIRELFSDF